MKQSVGKTLALEAARAAAMHEDVDAGPAQTDMPADAPPRNKGGRPRGKRPVAARQTLYLDDRRHAALAMMAEERGRSIHSLILEGIDYVIGKPNPPRWQADGGTKP